MFGENYIKKGLFLGWYCLSINDVLKYLILSISAKP